MLGLHVQVGERVGVGRVAGLVALGLRQLVLVEQDLLQLLGRAQVELAPDQLVGVLLDLLDAAAQLGLQGEQAVGVGRDADRLHVGEDEGQRKFQLGEQPRGAAGFEFGVEGVGEILDRSGVQRLDLGQSVVRLVEPTVQSELAGLLDVAAQLAAQVAQRKVGEVERALVRTQQVGRELGVAGDPVDRPTVLPQRQHRPLDVVDGLRHRRVAEPRRQRLVVVGRDPLRIDVRGRAVGARQRDPGERAGAPAPLPAERDARALAVPRVLVQPAGDVVDVQPGEADVEALLGLRLGSGDGREQPLAQHAELEVVEELVHLLAVPLLAGEVLGAERPARRRGRVG